jgi:hypothetical protein
VQGELFFQSEQEVAGQTRRSKAWPREKKSFESLILINLQYNNHNQQHTLHGIGRVTGTAFLFVES